MSEIWMEVITAVSHQRALSVAIDTTTPNRLVMSPQTCISACPLSGFWQSSDCKFPCNQLKKPLTSISVITQNAALRAEIKFAFFRALPGGQRIVLLHRTFVCD